MANRVDLRHPELSRLLRVQCGVLARRQLLDAGASEGDISRMRRRNEIRRVHSGVYVDHTGPLTYEQREWVAVLAAWPAALAGESAVPGRRPEVIEVAVEPGRTVRLPSGARLVRIVGLAGRLRRGAQPPRLRLAEAAVDVLSALVARDDIAEAYAELARLCFRRAHLPEAILAVMGARARVAGRSMIEDLVADLRTGACSVLERGYLHLIERAHGLPMGARQVASGATGALTVVDVEYADFGLIVELQGRAFHDSPEAYDADAARDLAQRAVGGKETLRISYGLVFDQPCRTATWVAAVLRRRGWPGGLVRCPRCPAGVRDAA